MLLCTLYDTYYVLASIVTLQYQVVEGDATARITIGILAKICQARARYFTANRPSPFSILHSGIVQYVLQGYFMAGPYWYVVSVFYYGGHKAVSLKRIDIDAK